MTTTNGNAKSFTGVLAAELNAIKHARLGTPEVPASAAETAEEVYRKAHEAHLLGVAFSGGGIRSATFNLGVLQALAKVGLLRRVDYLSTVSGGGYIGSWLAAWIKREGDLEKVNKKLAPQLSADEPADKSADEVEPIRFLRRYSNYLTPRTGLFGADTWSALSTYLRNLWLNLAIVLSLMVAAFLVPRVLMAVFQSCIERAALWPALGLLLIAIIAVGMNLAAIGDGTDNGGAAKKPPRCTTQGTILAIVVLPAFLAAYCATCWLWAQGTPPAGTEWRWIIRTSLWYTAMWFVGWLGGVLRRPAAHGIRGNVKQAGARVRLLQALRSSAGQQLRQVRWLPIILSALVAGAIGGALLWVLATKVFDAWRSTPGQAWHALSWGPPLVLVVLLLTAIVHIGLSGRALSNESREWFSRLGGWVLIWTICWASLFGIAIYLPLETAWVGGKLASTVTLAWLGSTAAGIWAGQSALTSSRNSPGKLDLFARAAPYIFIIGLFAVLSLGIQAAYAYRIGWFEPNTPAAPAASPETSSPQCTVQEGSCRVVISETPKKPEERSLWAILHADHWKLMWETYNTRVESPLLGRLSLDLTVFLICLAIAFVLSWRVDINEFSLHLLYRNRLVRAYLGASNRRRRPNPFTGFDPADDYRLSELTTRPYPLVNVALNLVAGDELGWQQRKAASFVLTPKYCGYEPAPKSKNGDEQALCGYRPTSEYAEGALSIGTALAISGAAASPNMGYHSSPPLAFLMTLFNVRLGWWLGNPRKETYRKAGPQFGFVSLLSELFAYTNEGSRFVYLSDGGHFENLGIYELVRRRCRFIIACDASQDGDMKFEDLGSAIRKCRADFGIDIDIDVNAIRKQAGSNYSQGHFAVGTIHYEAHDAKKSQPAPGILVYLKPSLTAKVPTDVLNYKATNDGFPHESTGDQWFDEAQFESYRQLGCYIGQLTFENAVAAFPSDVAVATKKLVADLIHEAQRAKIEPDGSGLS